MSCEIAISKSGVSRSFKNALQISTISISIHGHSENDYGNGNDSG